MESRGPRVFFRGKCRQIVQSHGAFGWVEIKKKQGVELDLRIYYPAMIQSWLTLPETNSSPLKIDPWKRRFLLETTIFRSYVSFRECKSRVFIGIPGRLTGVEEPESWVWGCFVQVSRCFFVWKLQVPTHPSIGGSQSLIVRVVLGLSPNSQLILGGSSQDLFQWWSDDPRLFQPWMAM